jgi:hypothetical protein
MPALVKTVFSGYGLIVPIFLFLSSPQDPIKITPGGREEYSFW